MKKLSHNAGEPVLLLDNGAVGSRSDELLTIPEVARLLKISVAGVRRLQQGRQLPFLKIGGSIRFFKSDIQSYLEKQRIEPIA
jgi:excisionase family DNA binding protein